jgi:3-methyladenine DNA glycosylase AlkC
MEALKNMYTPELLNTFADEVCNVYPAFEKVRFLDAVFDEGWNQRELKERYRHITQVLSSRLPEDYVEAIDILELLSGKFKGFPFIFFPDFVQVFGLEHWDTSICALRRFTPMNSSEFAVRPFIERDPDRMLGIMLDWTKDPDEHVRRLASEGCRPRLPWAPQLKFLQADPSLILPILEELKTDESEYVRRSVANNLNDISKDHPDLVLRIASEWLGKDPRTNWIIRHGCRSLLKKGVPDALRLFGFGSEQLGVAPNVEISGLTLSKDTVSIGEELTFTFHLTSEERASFRIQFGIDYVKATGRTSQKRFHLSEKKQFTGTESFERRISFKDLSTRKHYPGTHRLAILINGQETAAVAFEVVL